MFDLLTIAALADEFTGSLIDGRIQQVGLTSRLGIGLEIYAERRRRYLVASAETEGPKLLLLEREPSYDSQLVTPLLLLLRKYVRGGRIIGVEHPPLERIVRLSIAKRFGPHNHAGSPAEIAADEAGAEEEEEDDPEGLEDATYVHLVIELMGRHSNIMLLDDDDVVMESAKRVSLAMSSVRPIAPRVRYSIPPSGDRGDPRMVSAAEMQMLLGSLAPNAKIAKALPSALRGVSPRLAAEAGFRAFGDAEVNVGAARNDPGTLSRELRGLFEPLLTSAWNPVVYRDEHDDHVAFSAVPITHLESGLTAQSVDQISEAAALVELEPSESGRHSQRKTRLAAQIRIGLERVEKRLALLTVERERERDAAQFRRWGELLYAYSWSVAPGQTEAEIEGERIPLNPSLGPKENAREYIDRYHKAAHAGERLPALIEIAEHEAEYLRNLMLFAGQASTFPEIEAVTAEWTAVAANTGERKEQKSAPRSPRSAKRPRTAAEIEGNAVYLGRSSRENDAVTFEIAAPEDTWLHARGVPGSHVIVRWNSPQSEDDPLVIERAAQLAAFFSSARGSKSVEVDYTRRKHVRKIKGAGPGMVTYRNEHTVAVTPSDELIEKRAKG